MDKASSFFARFFPISAISAKLRDPHCPGGHSYFCNFLGRFPYSCFSSILRAIKKKKVGNNEELEKKTKKCVPEFVLVPNHRCPSLYSSVFKKIFLIALLLSIKIQTRTKNRFVHVHCITVGNNEMGSSWKIIQNMRGNMPFF